MSRSWTYDELQRVSEWMKARGFPSYEEFCKVLNDHDVKRKQYWNYLETLRRSGITNMYGAIPYLMKEFKIEYSEAKDILRSWMQNYNPDDYKDMEVKEYESICVQQEVKQNDRMRQERKRGQRRSGK